MDWLISSRTLSADLPTHLWLTKINTCILAHFDDDTDTYQIVGIKKRNGAHIVHGQAVIHRK